MDYAFNADPTSKQTSNATPKSKPQSKAKSKSTPKSIVPKKPKQTPAVKKSKKTPTKKSAKTPKITPPPKSNKIARKISLPKTTKEKPLPKRTTKPVPTKEHNTRRRTFLDGVNACSSKDYQPATKKSDALQKLNEFIGEPDSDD